MVSRTIKALSICLLLGQVSVKADTQIALLATNISLSSPWSYYTGVDAPEGAWAAPWASQSSVSATVNLNQTLAPGDYSVYLKALDYDHGNSNIFTLGGVTSGLNIFNDRDDNTGYWSTNRTVATVASTTNIVINFFRAGAGIQSLKWMSLYVTSHTNEIVLRDSRAVEFVYPSSAVAQTNKGNIIPNSSFEVGVDSFWRYLTLTRTNTIQSLWNTNVSWHGQSSLCLPGYVAGLQAQVTSNPFLISSNRAHSISVYAKTTNGTSYAWLYIYSSYTAPDGYTATYSSPNIGITANTSWQRISTSLTNVPWYPAGEYYISLITQNLSGGNYVFFDGLQIEEGDLTAYAPKDPFEFAIVPSETTRVFWNGANTNTLTIRGFNNSTNSIARRVDYRIFNNWNELVQSGATLISIAASNTALSDPIVLSTNRVGWFRCEFTVTNSPSDNELTYIMVQTPTDGIVEASNIGAHFSPLAFAAATAKRLGIKWDRTLSVGAGLSRWSMVEPTRGAFTYSTGAELLTNAGMTVMGILGEDLPTWMTNNNFLKTTNVTGNFEMNEILSSSSATGRVNFVFYSTNAMGTALQVTNLTGLVNFTSGSVTGQSSGATATILGSVITTTMDFRAYTNYLANIFTFYLGTIMNWEVWNEPNQDLIDFPDFNLYVEACRLASHWANIIDPDIRLMFGSGVSSLTSLSNVWTRLGGYTNAANFHAWTVHLYSGNEGDFSSVVSAYGKPVWNSETGVTDKHGLLGSRSSWRRAGHYIDGYGGAPAMQTAMWEGIRLLSLNYLTCIGYGQEKYFYYDAGLRNIGSADFDSIQYTFWDYDDSIRPKGAWLSSMGSVLGTATGQGALTVSGSSSFLFMRDTTPLVALWTVTTNKTITLSASVSASDLRIVDMMGNRTTPASLAINYGRMPILLEGLSGSQSNLTYAVTNGVVAARNDTAAPTLAILEFPHVAPNKSEMLKWLALDDVSTLEPQGILYSTSLNGAAWTEWSPDVWMLSKPTSLVSFGVMAKDAAGNMSTNAISWLAPASIRATTLNFGRIERAQ